MAGNNIIQNPGTGGSGSGVTSINSQTGVITLTSSGGTVVITEPSSGVINLESTGGGSSFPIVNPPNGTVTNYATLVSTYPPASYSGYFAWVQNSTGVPLINYHKSGWYYSDGSTWSEGTPYTEAATYISVNTTGFQHSTAADAQTVFANLDAAIPTSYSVVSVNGFAGSIANPTNSWALTLSTTITGILKGNGTAISAASAGTDYQAAGNYITALTGDATASGPGSVALTFATVNTNIGTFNNVTVNGKGLVTAASNVGYITGNQTITLSGHVTGSGTTAITTSSASKFILQGTTDSTVSAAQFLGALTTGIVKNTTTTGVLSIATAGTDYQGPITLTTTGTSGAATFIANTLNIPQYAGTTYSAGTGLTLTGSTFSVNVSQNITTLSNLTSNGLIKTSGGTGALSIATAGTDYQAPITLTTTGTSGAATFISNTLNIPNYAGGGSGNTVNINTTKIDQTPAGGTYGTLAGAVNGTNAVFTVSNGSYVSGTLEVILNGQVQKQGTSDFSETTPASGIFTFAIAPPTGSILQAAYITASSGSLGGLGTVSPFATGGTFTTPSSSTTSTVYRYKMVGAGGGGGGSNGAGASGGGGGAGAYAEGTFTGVAPSTAITITIGTAGTAGTSGATGGTGGSSSIGSPVSITCAGGAGGVGSTSATGVISLGGAGGAVTGSPNIISHSGTQGGYGYGTSGVFFVGGKGADSYGGLGLGGLPVCTTATVAGTSGQAGQGYGSGGGGNVTNNGAAFAGAGGYVEITQVTP